MNSENKNFLKSARVKARRSAVQALYQWQMTQIPMDELICEFENERKGLRKADIDYFRDLLSGTTKLKEKLDIELSPFLDRKAETLDPIERAILHIGTYELMYHPELPWRVVINESIELAKRFGAEQSHKYINGVLDKVAHHIRESEIKNTA